MTIPHRSECAAITNASRSMVWGCGGSRERDWRWLSFLPRSPAMSLQQGFVVVLINPESGLEAAQTHHAVGFEEIIIFVTDIFSASPFFLCPFQVLCSFVFIWGIWVLFKIPDGWLSSIECLFSLSLFFFSLFFWIWLFSHHCHILLFYGVLKISGLLYINSVRTSSCCT